MQLPSPVWGFKAVSVKDGMVVLSWSSKSSKEESNFVHFEVLYKKMGKDEVTATVFDENQVRNWKRLLRHLNVIFHPLAS